MTAWGPAEHLMVGVIDRLAVLLRQNSANRDRPHPSLDPHPRPGVVSKAEQGRWKLRGWNSP